jgi:hypothetical protein
LVTSPLLLGVYGDTSASYEIMATGLDREDVIQLIPDIRFNGVVRDGLFDYYYVRPGRAYEDMKLMLLIFQGDADLYVSKTWETRPKWDTAQNKVISYDAASNVDGDDSLRLKVCFACSSFVFLINYSLFLYVSLLFSLSHSLSFLLLSLLFFPRFFYCFLFLSDALCVDVF